ncbi:putative Rna helicase [Leptomonas pyrrhocoris]|uniref:RNA helicase n=1 Tax=Leptomonas pyrrhocoris TaxID=157538 RepID=A0A0N0VE55_LEPPY|nr:putative Rna helicase [Leptomonas pyrrhocoris]KPA77428.1 putative Rna helicase [Leptomonas pyrrhocoris]|eukprot:XP_015655867.1 putative Rna helicase [Leptomonas pyrrhocoris]
MGPNRQRKPQSGGRGGRGRGRGAAPAPAPAKATPSMITNAGRDLIVDVLHHAASGGSVPVPEKHFDAKIGSRITFQRNSPLTPSEILQRLYEGLGFPRDLVTQYLTDLAEANEVPAFSDVSELLDETGAFQPFLVRSSFELFNCMTWFSREETDDKITPEEGDAMLEEEMTTVESLFSDSFLGRSHFDDGDTEDREVYFCFRTAADKQVLIVLRFPDFYPAETPSVHIQPLRSGTTDAAPSLVVAPSCTKDISASNRRAIMDAAVNAINGFVGTGCLLALVSAIHGAVTSQEESQPASPTPQQDRAAILKERAEAQQQRKAFMSALTGKHDGSKNDADDNEEQDRFIQVSMPEKVELATVDAASIIRDTQRREFLLKDAALDATLKASWQKLRKEGTLRKSRDSLPAHNVRETLRSALKQHNVVVIGGETGSGKTTQIPQFLYEFMCEEGNGSAANILCTQPRRLAATSVALRVAEERDEAVGGTVGYSIRLENCVSKKTQITYLTTGIVLRRLQTDKFLGRVSHVVVDEIHERGVDTDFLLILLRDLVRRRTDLKVVLMSATMDSELFARYFDGAPVISIAGRTFPVRVMHLEQIIPEVQYTLEDASPYEKISGDKETRRRNTRKNVLNLDLEDVEEDTEREREQQKLARVVKASPKTLDILARMNFDVINYELIEYIVEYIDNALRIPGAVLVFLPGMAEIQRCMEQLSYNPRLAKACLFYNLHSSLGSSEQQGVFRKPPPGKRKVILGTNIMETSITIDDAVFVIDTGKAKENRYNARKSLSELVTVNISKANCRQRQGRAGRVQEGFCFRLFTGAQFDAFEDHQLCEMHRVPLESLILQIYALHLGDEVEYLQKALSPPEERAIHSSVKVLTTLGALTAEKRLTSLGQHLANLPLDVRVGKMIIHGALLQCIDPVLTMAACLASRSPFIASIDFRTEVENMRRAFAGETLSDQLASWFAYNKWATAVQHQGAGAARKICQECYLSPAALQQIQSTKRQYERYLVEAGFIDNANRSRVSPNKFVFPPFTTMDDRVFEAGGPLFNDNSSSSRCILACLVAGLYPNVARLRVRRGPKGGGGGGGPGHSFGGRPAVKFSTFDGSECLIHPSSVAGKETSFSSPLVVYVDKVKTSATFLREVSVVAPLHVILFGSGNLEYLPKYEELCVDEMTAFKCRQDDATLLTHLKTQLDSALTQKINDPSKSWESISSVVVRAIVKLLKEDGGRAGALTIVDRRQPRAPLTEPLVPDAPAAVAAQPTVPDDQPFKTNKSCFLCGETGHVSRYCPHNSAHSKGGPPVRCFICGQWHFPQDCTLVKPLKR